MANQIVVRCPATMHRRLLQPLHINLARFVLLQLFEGPEVESEQSQKIRVNNQSTPAGKFNITSPLPKLDGTLPKPLCPFPAYGTYDDGLERSFYWRVRWLRNDLLISYCSTAFVLWVFNYQSRPRPNYLLYCSRIECSPG